MLFCRFNPNPQYVEVITAKMLFLHILLMILVHFLMFLTKILKKHFAPSRLETMKSSLHVCPKPNKI